MRHQFIISYRLIYRVAIAHDFRIGFVCLDFLTQISSLFLVLLVIQNYRLVIRAKYLVDTLAVRVGIEIIYAHLHCETDAHDDEKDRDGKLTNLERDVTQQIQFRLEGCFTSFLD